MDELAKQVVLRHDEFKKGRSPSEDLINECLEMAQPNRGSLEWRDTEGEKFAGSLYDDTAVHAASLFANTYQGFSTSPAFPWFRAFTVNPKMMDNDRIREWVTEEVEYKFYQQLNRSNFYDQQHQYLLDGIVASSSTQHIEDDPKDNVAKVIISHPRENFYSVDKFGEIQCYHRYFKMSVYTAAQAFKLKNLSPELQRIYKTNPFNVYEFLYVEYPKGDPLEKYWTKGKRNTFLTAVVEVEQLHTVTKAGAPVRKTVTWRPRYNISEIYGRGPASDAIVSMLRCNESGYNLSRAESLEIAPPMIGPTALENRLDISPYGYTGYDPLLASGEVAPLIKGARMPFGIELQERYQKSVEKFFLVDLWTMMTAQTPPMDKVLTATQAMYLNSMQSIMLGPIMASSKRVTMQFFNRFFWVEYSKGRIENPPVELYNMAENDKDLFLAMEFIGPLNQAQRKYFKQDSMRAAFEELAFLLDILGPDVLDRIDKNELVEHVLENHDFPEKLLKSDAEVEKLQKARALQEQQLINLQKLREASEATKNLGKPIDKTSPLGESA